MDWLKQLTSRQSRGTERSREEQLADIDALLEATRELVRCLRESGHTFWAERVASFLQQMENGDFAGVEGLLASYGTSGSLNDLIVAPHIDRLLSHIYELASNVRRDFNRTE